MAQIEDGLLAQPSAHERLRGQLASARAACDPSALEAANGDLATCIGQERENLAALRAKLAGVQRAGSKLSSYYRQDTNVCGDVPFELVDDLDAALEASPHVIARALPALHNAIARVDSGVRALRELASERGAEGDEYTRGKRVGYRAAADLVEAALTGNES